MKAVLASTRTRSSGGCGMAIVAALVACVTVGLVLGVLFWRPSAPASAVRVDAEVAADVLTLHIKNRGEADWPEARVTINGSFSRSVGNVGMWEEIRVPLAAFVDGAGNRFDPRRSAVVDVVVAVRFSDGESQARYEIRR